MPSFLFNLYDGRTLSKADEGQDFPNVTAAKACALDGLRDCIATDVRAGAIATTAFIEICDERRQVLDTVRFEDAVRLTSQPFRSDE